MPEPGSKRRSPNTRRATRKTSSAQDETPKNKSIYDSATVQDRIRQWQVQGVDALDPDAISTYGRPRSEAFQTPPRSPAPSSDGRNARTTPRKSSTRWVHKSNQEWVKERRSRAKEQETADSRDESRTSRRRPRNSEQDVHPPLTREEEELRAVNISYSRAEREERRRRRREARAHVADVNKFDDGIRVYPKSESLAPSDRYEDPYDSKPVEDEDDREEPPESPKNVSEDMLLSDSDYEPNQVDHEARPSKYAETLGKAPQHQENDNLPGRKRDIFSKTKGILTGKVDQPQAISNRLPSIEAWLDDQPDPFVEDARDDSSAIDVPAPLKFTPSRKKVSIGPTIHEDPNKIWDSISPPPVPLPQESSKSKRRKSDRRNSDKNDSAARRMFSFEMPIDDQKVDVLTGNESSQNNSPTPLRRRGAKGGKSHSRRSTIAADATIPFAELAQSPEFNASPSIRKAAESDSPSALDHAFTQLRDENLETFNARTSTSLKRKLTTHEDLISVLSRSHTRKSNRSVRRPSQHVKSSDTMIQELLAEASQEEGRYSRELRTLVDGVTPVLLQSFLSKSDSAAAAGLFANGAKEDATLTRSVIEMAVAVERLKSLHNRIPLGNVGQLHSWAQTAHKSYTDYVKAWRLGFTGVLVNLAPLNDNQLAEDENMARDDNGDVVNAEGQRVDVAYLQKRPLVRLKKLSKLFDAIREVMPESAIALKIAIMYSELTETARKRHRAEQGRLEDEAAADIDVTRTRDIRSLGPTTEAKLDRSRKVRARDCFNMTMFHSTGQRMDCRVELILRDNPDSTNPGGDVLICQVQDDGEWLLFAPVELNKISARKGEAGCDLVVMIRGRTGLKEDWHELLALQCEEAIAAVEWMNMLGSNPLPPKLSRLPSFIAQSMESAPDASDAVPVSVDVQTPISASALANIASDIDIPIGEPSVLGGKRRRRERTSQADKSIKELAEKSASKLSLGGGLQQKRIPEHYQAQAARADHNASKSQAVQRSDPSVVSDQSRTTANPRLPPTSQSAPVSILNGTDMLESRPSSAAYSPQKGPLVESHLSDPLTSRSQVNMRQLKQSSRTTWTQPEDVPMASGALPYQTTDKDAGFGQTQRPEPARRISSTPDGELPRISRMRGHEKTKSTTSVPLTESIRDQWAAISGISRKIRGHSFSAERSLPSRRKSSPPQAIFTDDLPAIQQKLSSPRGQRDVEFEQPPPPPPPHRQRSPTRPASTAISISLPPQPPAHARDVSRLSSSPLKHQYEPSSSASEEASDSEDESDTSSNTSDEWGSEDKDQFMPLQAVGPAPRHLGKVSSQPLPSVPTSGSRTLQPSDSASQGPYRRAPPPSAYPADKKKRTIATVCSWSDNGVWTPVQDDECSIVISPGLIQAFGMTAAHSLPMKGADWQQSDLTSPSPEDIPLVEFELTPVVPLRKGTALDITIRSPPTSNSQIKTTSNIMFRSRSVLECDKLYNMINWARCNNPTYAALSRSRAQEQPPVTFATNVEETRTRSWFSFGSRNKSSYRAASRPPSSMGESMKSSSTTASAFSALKRFGKNSPFSLNRSSVIRRPGLQTGESLYSASTGTGQSSGSSTPAPSQAGFVPGPEGPNVPATSAEAVNGGGMVNNMKIRLFVRRGQKWEALGASALTVLPAVTGLKDNTRPGSVQSTPPASRRASEAGLPSQPPPPPSIRAPPSNMTSTPGPRLPSSSHTPHRVHLDGREKRILITKHKDSSQILLDEILGESCFEKIMQTGIAVNVWKEDDQVANFGGVLTGRGKVYMLQFKTSAEAGWVFGLCGGLRYGPAAGVGNVAM